MMNRIRRMLLGSVVALSGLMAVPAASAADGELVLVAGATGRTGSLVVDALLSEGYRVRALVREGSDGAAKLPAGVEQVIGDVRESATLAPAVKGVDYVISAAGASGMNPEPGNTPEDVDYKGTVALAKAAQAAGVKQLVLVSSAGTSQADTYPFEPMRPVLKAKWKAEEFLRAGDLPYTIVRPGGLTLEPGGTAALVFSQGDREPGRVARADVAAVTVAALGRESAVGRTFELKSADGKAKSRRDWNSLFGALEPDAHDHSHAH